MEKVIREEFLSGNATMPEEVDSDADGDDEGFEEVDE